MARNDGNATRDLESVVSDPVGSVRPDPAAPLEGWQDIGTAPADGTNVLVWAEDLGWYATGKPIIAWNRGKGWNTAPGCYSCKPTHWMALPPVPAPTLEKK